MTIGIGDSVEDLRSLRGRNSGTGNRLPFGFHEATLSEEGIGSSYQRKKKKKIP